MSEASIKRAERRAKAIDLLGGVCVNCGTTNNLAFDHVKNDRRDSRHLVSQLLQCRWDRVLQELRKCQLLCATCHGKKTRQDYGFGEYSHGTISMYNNLGCRCNICTAANAVYHKFYKKRVRHGV